MTNDTIRSVRLEEHETRDIIDKHVNGKLIVIWRNWDKVIDLDPKMMYITSVNPGEIKGPHLHTKRDSYFMCISGKVVIVAKDLSGNYHEIILNEEEPILVQIPKNHPSAHINIHNGPSKILVLANIAWKPNDNEMVNVNFDDYDWNKWNKNGKKTS